LEVERRDGIAIFNEKGAKDEQEMCCTGHHQVGEQDGQTEQREERGTYIEVKNTCQVHYGRWSSRRWRMGEEITVETEEGEFIQT
jgi:hypothetical protein